MHKHFATGLAALALSLSPAFAAPAIVASIKPVHSLVAAVMGDLGTPGLIVSGTGSPHTYAMKPSDAGALQNADLVFWIGPDMENFLISPLQNLSSAEKTVTLAQTPGLTLLAPREGGTFEEDDHDHGAHADHDDHDHDDHAHEDHDDHDAHEDHDDHAEADHDHAAHDHEGHVDAHLWLDPANAKLMLGPIADALSAADPENADAYRANAAATEARLDQLIADTKALLAPVKDRPFVVFHDAYHYFENRFDIAAAGSIVIEPDTPPGVQRVAAIRDKLRELHAACVFSEPEFESALVQTVIEGSNAKTGVLDPLGAAIPNGPDLYFTLISDMANSLAACLAD